MAAPRAHATAAQAAERISHARELMGSRYSKSVVRQGEKVTRIDKFIKNWTRRSLPAKWKKRSSSIARAILKEARKHEFDPVFLMAVIESESSFDPHRKGSAGEIGLMQILPATGEWTATREHIKWKGPKTLKDPIANIRIGAAHMAWLREHFDSHARLYLAAYNMGRRNVNEALERNIWPRDYPFRVMNHYVAYYRELRSKLQNGPARTLASADADQPAHSKKSHHKKHASKKKRASHKKSHVAKAKSHIARRKAKRHVAEREEAPLPLQLNRPHRSVVKADPEKLQDFRDDETRMLDGLEDE